MRLGLVARCDNSGLGIQTWEYFRHLDPAKTLVIDVGHLAARPRHCNKQSHRDRYPDATFNRGWTLTDQTVRAFLDGLDVVLGAETFYTPNMYRIAREMGVKTVLAPNWEFLDPQAEPDLWLAPSLWHYDDIPEPKQHLPVPLATDRFPLRELPDVATHILHIVGRPAVHDRNGTHDLLAALQYVDAPITVTIKCQAPDYVRGLLNQFGIAVPPHITLNIDTTSPENYWDNYRGDFDLAVMPRRYGGLCLPVNEAIAAGLPVLMPGIDPNNTWLPPEWLLPASPQGSFAAKQTIIYYSIDHWALAERINQYATDPDAYALAKTKAKLIRATHSWTALQAHYRKALTCT